MATCKSCGTPIMWAIRIISTKKIPLVLYHESYGSTPRYTATQRSDGQWECERDDNGKFMSHFANCPNAGGHSRGTRR